MEASSVWRALQKNTGSEARVELVSSVNARKRYVAPVRTLAEAQSFYGMLCTGSEVLSLSPLVVKMPRFASHDECDTLLKLSDDAQRSTIDNEQVTTSHRTSRTKWLDDDEVPSRLSERAAMVSELPMSNAERWQLAQYGENCEYKLHVDTVPEFNDLAPGGRFSTLLLYLDEPEEGGTTDFPDLGLRIKPETGTALYFRNVREPVSDPFSLETHESSCHAGAPVLKGAKHIATRWVHPVPYPDYLRRWQDKDVGDLESALEAVLAKVRAQRADARRECEAMAAKHPKALDALRDAATWRVDDVVSPRVAKALGWAPGDGIADALRQRPKTNGFWGLLSEPEDDVYSLELFRPDFCAAIIAASDAAAEDDGHPRPRANLDVLGVGWLADLLLIVAEQVAAAAWPGDARRGRARAPLDWRHLRAEIRADVPRLARAAHGRK